MELSVVPSFKAHFKKSHQKYIVNYATEETRLGCIMVATIGAFLCSMSFLNDSNGNCSEKDLKKLKDKFPDAEDIIPNVEHVRRVIDVRNLTVCDIPKLKMLVMGTTFQEAVWRELLKIPRGSTVYYSELAERIGKPNAVRAVGTAVGRNPIGYIIPCHRVIGKNGNILKFAAGPDVKKRLLTSEGNADKHI